MKWLILALVLLIPSISGAYEFDRALNNLAEEFSACAVYYIMCEKSLAPDQRDEKLVQNLKQASTNAMEYSTLASNEKVLDARLKLHTGNMMKQVNYSFDNLSILDLEFSGICKEASESPFKRLKYWLDKK